MIEEMPVQRSRTTHTSLLTLKGSFEMAKECARGAFNWTQTIDDQTMRNDTLHSVAKRWHRVDSERLHEAVAASTMSEQAKMDVVIQLNNH